MSRDRFGLSCSTVGLLVVPLVLLLAPTARAAGKAAVNDQLRAPTHRQIRVIEPKVDGKTPKLHTITTTADGNLLAAVGGQSMQYVMKESGYETKLVQEPGFLLLLDSEGNTLKQWKLELTPTAVAVAPDGTIYVAGSGQIAKLDAEGSVVLKVDSPHVGSVEDLRKKTVESIRESRSRMSETFADQIETLRERVDKIEEKDDDDRSRLEQAQLKAFQTQLEMLERMTGKQGDDGQPEVDDAELDMAVIRAMSVTSMAASDQDVFICATDPGQGGYSIWRLGRDLDLDSSELIMENLRGCCGQMDIQCCGESLLVSQNAKFQVGIYDRNGRIQGSFGRRDRTSRNGFGGCCNPMNSLGMKDGSILVAESSIGHIKRFDTDGKLVAYIGKAAIGAGCKHCALGYDESNDLYYMMYQDKNSICVLANNESTPMTLAEKGLQQRQTEFLAQAAGHWSLKQEGEKSKLGSLFSLFGGGRGGSSQHPITSLQVSEDGSAKILEGMYKAYGDKSQLEVLDEPEGAADTVQFALAIDQMRFLEGTWKFDDTDTATLTFPGQSPVTLVRQSKEAGKPTGIGPDIYVENGQLWESTGEVDKAMENYTKALESDPDHAPALTSLARLYFRQGEHKQAADFFQRAIVQSPEDAGLHNDLGLTLGKLGDHAAATKSLEKALELAPGTSRYANNLASVRFEAGDSSSAYQVLADNNKPAVAHFNMAYLHFKHGQVDEAKEHLSQALRFEPQASDDAAIRRTVDRSREMLAQIEGGKASIAHATPNTSIVESQLFGDDSPQLSFQQTSPTRTDEDCENEDCPESKASAALVAAVKAAQPAPPTPPPPPKVRKQAEVEESLQMTEEEVTEDEVVEYEAMMKEAMDEDGMFGMYDFEAQMPKPTFEYKVLSKKQLGKKLQAKLNKMGAEGWEFCGRVGKQMMFKRMSGFEMMESAKE